MSDQTPAYAQLHASLRDAYREAGWGLGFTFPNQLQVDGRPVPGPFVRLDYIFHSEALQAETAYVDCAGSSTAAPAPTRPRTRWCFCRAAPVGRR